MKALLIALFFVNAALAGLPPTSSRISGETSNKTTFSFQFPNFAGTRTGTTLSLGVNSVAGGGTGASSLTANSVLLGSGTSPVQSVAPGTSGNILTSNGTTWTSAAPAGGGITTLNTLTATTQTFAFGSSGTTPNVSSATSTHTFNFPLASGAGVTSGTISKTEYDTFSGKVGGPASSADGEIALFDLTTGKLIKRATGTGFVKATAGVYSASASVNAGTELTGITPVANGGTGASSLTADSVILGNGTAAVQLVAPGTSGNVLKSNGTTWTSGAVPMLVAFIKDVKTNGSLGGASVAGTQTRALNTLEDPDGIVSSLASDQFTLPAGTYTIEVSAPAFRVDRHQVRLNNVTDGTQPIIGAAAFSGSVGDYGATRAILAGTITTTASKVFQVLHQTATVNAGGLGLDMSSGHPEVFTIVKITRR